MMAETIERLRPKFTFAKSLDEANDAVEEAVNKYREQVTCHFFLL